MICLCRVACGQELFVDPTPSTTAFPPPSPFTDAQFLYRHFRPSLSDPQQGDWYFRMFVPPSYDVNGSEKYPVVIFLHGLGEVQAGTANTKQMVNNGQFAFCQPAKQEIFPCFFLLPATSGQDFNLRSQTIKDLLAELAEQYRIDLDRVVLTGLSYGGGHTIRLASAIPEVFCAAVPLSSNADATLTPGMLRLPMWYFTAKNDGATPPATALSNAQTRIFNGGQTNVTLFNTGGHSSSVWSAAWGGSELISWLALQRRGLPMRGGPADVRITTPTRNPAHQRPTGTHTFSGTVSSSATAALTKVEYANGSYVFAGLGSTGTNVVLGTTPTTIANWTAGSLNLGFSSGPVRLTVAAVGTSWSSSLGGETYYLSGLPSTFVSGSLLAPENLSARLAAVGEAELTWEYPASGTAHTGFKIERRVGNSETFTEIATPLATQRSYIDAGLVGDARYYYRVRATTGAANSFYTREQQVKVLNDADRDGMPDFWETLYQFNPADAADAELDADGDQQNNLLEYALDTPPRYASGKRLSVSELDGVNNTFALRYRKAREELKYTVEGSVDLSVWSRDTINQGNAEPGQIERATYPLGSEPAYFLRLRVSRP
jgi:predicted esterase